MLQVHTASSRLPGKALMPIGDTPSAVLAGRRLTNTGQALLVATTDDPTDDCLALVLERSGLEVTRGAKEDVLGRIVDATGDLPDDGIVIRATADNVFPDGSLVEELHSAFVECGADYLGTRSPSDDLPYGLSLEAIRVAALRRAAERATDAHDREHVTSWISRVSSRGPWRPRDAPRGLARLRCTLDTQTDYRRMCEVFRDIPDPQAVGWRDLCDRLASLESAPSFRIPWAEVDGLPHGQLVLGTAQLGMAYGRTNVHGVPSAEIARQLVLRAIDHGVSHIDTARAYGDSERVVGAALHRHRPSHVQVVTKLLPLDPEFEDSEAPLLKDAVDASIFHSCVELGVRSLDTVLLHRPAARTSHKGVIWDRLLELRDLGHISNLGASVYGPEEAEAALSDLDITHLQLPFNLLDWRWGEAGFDRAIRDRPDVLVHARSLLLQGILSREANQPWPAISALDGPELTERLRRAVALAERDSLLDLAIAYARGHDWIDGFVVGVETMAQLDSTMQQFTREPLSATAREAVDSEIGHVPAALLDPSGWPS